MAEPGAGALDLNSTHMEKGRSNCSSAGYCTILLAYASTRIVPSNARSTMDTPASASSPQGGSNRKKDSGTILWGDRAVRSLTIILAVLCYLHDNCPPPRSLDGSTNALDSNASCQRPRSMGLFSIFLASLLVPHRASKPSDDLEDLEKARQEEEFAGDEDDDEDEQRRHDPGANDLTGDDDESVHDSDPQDNDEDEPEETPRAERRVTFGGHPEESRESSEKDDAKPGIFARLKAVVFPSHDDDKPLSASNHRVLPILSGLIIPFSILLEIPGLTDNWYIRTDGNVVVETKPNPVILDVGLGFSMFFALVANISLICRFLDKGPVLVTTLISVTSLTVHGNFSHRNSAVDCLSTLPRFDQHRRSRCVRRLAPVQ